ncbi:hypothetical protein Mesau_05842 [Mesorhizobium australicum WSM2073]|uniref:Uncharacterized protein n=3 Tax=Mesorhizobium TaxID=68287 RepID=L0KSI3_MESAW|nr:MULTISPECIES: hypothetical protein [Mesorhizobium]ADV14824.1 hypothetical protein Mesci_5793 [Mesorhizobium ciceri biovar biserrulae WSM1271]AEH90714.1 hypothetical protein Mesop_6370 [Mesorhizobium opportunistum WSM2075]AGB48081.1 hypothetical protein Mesau_05842 [Mesorhizobium australicum WSM2073]
MLRMLLQSVRLSLELAFGLVRLKSEQDQAFLMLQPACVLLVRGSGQWWRARSKLIWRNTV